MKSNQSHLYRHRYRRCCTIVLLSLISLSASPHLVSSFLLDAHNIISHIGDTESTNPSSFSAKMQTSRLRHHFSSLPAKSGSDTNEAQTQFVTNKRCPFAQKAWIALEATECPYTMREVSLYGAGGKPDWFGELNPQGTVPVVVVNDGSGGEHVFADSELILDAVGDGRVCGKNGALHMNGLSGEENIRIGEWREIISQKLVPVGKSAVLGGSRRKLQALLRELNSMVLGPYLVGEKLTLADCAAFPFLWRIDQEFGIGRNDGEDMLRSWLDKCVVDSSIKKTIPVQGWWWWW